MEEQGNVIMTRSMENPRKRRGWGRTSVGAPSIAAEQEADVMLK